MEVDHCADEDADANQSVEYDHDRREDGVAAKVAALSPPADIRVMVRPSSIQSRQLRAGSPERLANTVGDQLCAVDGREHCADQRKSEKQELGPLKLVTTSSQAKAGASLVQCRSAFATGFSKRMSNVRNGRKRTSATVAGLLGCVNANLVMVDLDPLLRWHRW